MRVDKYLKVSRIVKRRPLAKEICDAGRVTVNGKVAKASTEIKEGDVLVLKTGLRELKVEVLNTPNSCPAKEAALLYRVLNKKTNNDIYV